jgi:hypothetical protein
MGIYSIYGQRSQSLKALGFENYTEYLGSDTWKKIRKEVIKRNNGKCQACGLEQSLNVHHTNYSPSILGGKIKGLYLLCVHCHDEVHILSRKLRMSIKHATKRIIRERNGADGHCVSPVKKSSPLRKLGTIEYFRRKREEIAKASQIPAILPK